MSLIQVTVTVGGEKRDRRKGDWGLGDFRKRDSSVFNCGVLMGRGGFILLFESS